MKDMEDFLDKLEEKLRTILTLRLKIQLSEKWTQGDLEKYSRNFAENYLYDTISTVIVEIDDLMETTRTEIDDEILLEFAQAQDEENSFDEQCEWESGNLS